MFFPRSAASLVLACPKVWDGVASPYLLRGECWGLQVPACTAPLLLQVGRVGGAVVAEICSPAKGGDTSGDGSRVAGAG